MKTLYTSARSFVLLGVGLSLAQVSNGQSLDDRIIYSRESVPSGTIWLNDGAGVDSIFISTGQSPKLQDGGRYIFFTQGNTVGNPYYNGNWMRYSALTGTSTLLYASTDYLVGSAMVLEDSSNVVSFGCNLYHNDFNNMPIGTVSTNCYDDAPDVRTVEPRVVCHNMQERLYIMNLDGTGRTAVPHTNLHDTWPTWSPDGQWLLFGRCNYAVTGAHQFDVVNFYKVKPNGDSLTMLTQNDTLGPTVYTSNAMWNADGSAIITAGTINGTYGLMLIAADGSGVQQAIPTTPGDVIGFVSGNSTAHISGAGITSMERPARLAVWPIPAQQEVNLSLSDPGPWQARLFDLQGSILRTAKGDQQFAQFPLTGLSTGAYYLEVTSLNGKWTERRTVVKE